VFAVEERRCPSLAYLPLDIPLDRHGMAMVSQGPAVVDDADSVPGEPVAELRVLADGLGELLIEQPGGEERLFRQGYVGGVEKAERNAMRPLFDERVGELERPADILHKGGDLEVGVPFYPPEDRDAAIARVAPQVFIEERRRGDAVVTREKDEGALRLADPGVAGLRGPPRRPGERFQVRHLPGGPAEQLPGAVGRPVVHDDDLETVGRDGLGAERLQALLERRLPVARGDHHAHARAVIVHQLPPSVPRLNAFPSPRGTPTGYR